MILEPSILRVLRSRAWAMFRLVPFVAPALVARWLPA